MKTGLFVFGVLLLLAGIALVLGSIVVIIIALVRKGKAAAPAVAVASQPVAPVPTAPPAAAPPVMFHGGETGTAPPDATVVLPLRQGAGAGALRCLKGPRQGSVYPIPPEGFWIGRDPASAQVIVDNGAVSKRHVWIGPRDGKVAASDPGSTNGTYLQSDPTKRISEVILQPGDVVVIADDLARFEYQQ